MADHPSPGKTVSASRISIAQLMQPEHANNLGNVHGGEIMRLVDEAGALACMRHANQRVVTVAVDQMTFREPIKIGQLVILTAEVSYVGRTSLEATVEVVTENPLTGQRTHTNTAHVVYVALDETGKPVQVPPLIPETDHQRLRMEQGRQRQEYRLAQARNAKLEDVTPND
jgi:uncharacterized protein (TIGR00369 family)